MQQKKTTKPLDPRKVKVALAIKGWTQTQLARAIGVSRTTVNLTIHHDTSQSTNRAIRKALSL